MNRERSMTRRLKKAEESLRQARNFVAGILIGAAVATPVFAAAEITRDDWTTLGLLVSVILLGAGLLLQVRTRAKPTASAPEPEDCIGRYRPQIYRP
jgi:hypothetical protein